MANVLMGWITKINLIDRKIDCRTQLPIDTKLAHDFFFYEMMDPTTNELILCPTLLEITQQARTETGYEIHTNKGLSWYRGEEYNKKVKGSPTSLHLEGLAHDSKWYKDGVQASPVCTAYEMYIRARSRGLFCEVGIYFPGYDGESTGYMHFGIHPSKSSIYYCKEKGKLIYVKSLLEVPCTLTN